MPPPPPIPRHSTAGSAPTRRLADANDALWRPKVLFWNCLLLDGCRLERSSTPASIYVMISYNNGSAAGGAMRQGGRIAIGCLALFLAGAGGDAKTLQDSLAQAYLTNPSLRAVRATLRSVDAAWDGVWTHSEK